jgi:glutathione S-transferase
MPNPIITAFEASPDRGRGLARDMRVRWALEEVGQPYDVRLLSFEAMKQPEHLARHPFGQIPTYEEANDQGALTLFESGSIVLHLAERHPGALLPADPNARARAITWMFAALNTVEPPVFDRSIAAIVDRDQPWLQHRLESLDAAIARRLAALADHLGASGWLDGDFSAGDLLMATVLLRANAFGALAAFPTLAAYLARAEARPAFQRAFAAQRAVFEASAKG